MFLSASQPFVIPQLRIFLFSSIHHFFLIRLFIFLFFNFLSSLYILDISHLLDLGLVKVFGLIDGVLCLTEALQFYEVPFVDSRSYNTSHWCSVQETFPCVHIFEALPHFLLYKFQCLLFDVEFFDPLRLELCTRR
jgi:ABC-type Fe3+-siderophore transport system permease subunit